MELPKLDVFVYGIKRGYNVLKPRYRNLFIELGLFYDLNIIEIINDIGVYSNKRSNEYNLCSLPYKFDDKSKSIVKDFRNDLEYSAALNMATSSADPYIDDYSSIRNLIQKLLMLKAASDFCTSENVLILRDDVFFETKKLVRYINVYHKKFKYSQTFLTSVYHGNTGLCDRWMFANVSIAKTLLNRIEDMAEFLQRQDSLNYCKNIGLNSEQLLRFSTERYRIDPVCCPLFMTRVRGDNSFQRERLFSHPRNWLHETPSIYGCFRYYKRKVALFQNY